MASTLDEFARWRRDHGPQYSTSSRCTPKGHSENTAIPLVDLEIYLKQRHPIHVAGSFTHHEPFCTPSVEPTSQPKPKPVDDKPVFRQFLLKNPADADAAALVALRRHGSLFLYERGRFADEVAAGFLRFLRTATHGPASHLLRMLHVVVSRLFRPRDPRLEGNRSSVSFTESHSLISFSLLNHRTCSLFTNNFHYAKLSPPAETTTRRNANSPRPTKPPPGYSALTVRVR